MDWFAFFTGLGTALGVGALGVLGVKLVGKPPAKRETWDAAAEARLKALEEAKAKSGTIASER
jgi:hypothetical protein